MYFDLAGQTNIADLIVRLGMAKSPDAVGRSFQGHSGLRLVIAGGAGLTEHAQHLPIDARLTDPSAVDAWRCDAAADSAPEEATPSRREYRREMAIRDRALVADLKRLYGGRCQISGATPLDGIAGEITEAHHIQWLTRGGSDTRDNLVVLSPDWHAAVHAADAEFDWSALAFIVNGRRFPLALNHHLRPKAR